MISDQINRLSKITYFLYPLFKKILFLFPPEFSHDLSFKILKILNQFSSLPWRERQSEGEAKDREGEKITIAGLNFINPIGLAAGLDKNGEYLDILSNSRFGFNFGFIEIGTVTPKAQLGNKKPRLFRLVKDQALINKMGFNNSGIDQLIINLKKSNFYKHKLNKTNPIILGINIGKNLNTPIDQAISDYLIGLEKAFNYADYITINISSPNTQDLRQLQTENYLDNFLKNLKIKQAELEKKYSKKTPLFIKIAPDLSDQEIKTMSEIFLKNKIEGLIATNTLLNRPPLKTKHTEKLLGGLSGAPIFNQSLKTIQAFNLYLNHQIPMIGVGGIHSPEQAELVLNSGADLIQIYTGLIYEGPGLISNIIQSLRRL